MRLIRFKTQADGTGFVNPDHVAALQAGGNGRDMPADWTYIHLSSGPFGWVKGDVDWVAQRLRDVRGY